MEWMPGWDELVRASVVLKSANMQEVSAEADLLLDQGFREGHEVEGVVVVTGFKDGVAAEVFGDVHGEDHAAGPSYCSQDADFSGTFMHRHHHRVKDTQGCDGHRNDRDSGREGLKEGGVPEAVNSLG